MRSPGWFTEKIDCWALGVVFYEILEGRHPFQGPNESLSKKEFQRRVVEQDLFFKKTTNLKYVMLITRMLEKVTTIYRESSRKVERQRSIRSVFEPANSEEVCDVTKVQKI